MNNTPELYQARIAINLIALVLSHCDDADILAYVSNATAALRDLFGDKFIDWELISDTCDQREYVLSTGKDDARITRSTFSPIINRIQACCGLDATQMLDEFKS